MISVTANDSRCLRAWQLQVNLTLSLEPFHTVRAEVVAPAAPTSVNSENSPACVAAVTDLQGHQLPYGVRSDATTHTVQALLPDGSYSFQASLTPYAASTTRINGSLLVSPDSRGVPLSGQAEFNVAGQSLSKLRVTLAPETTNSLPVTVIHGSSGALRQVSSEEGSVFVTVSQAGSAVTDDMNTQFAEGAAPATLETSSLNPGAYWVHLSVTQAGLCEASFTAGGASLAQEPLRVGPGGAIAPLALTLRDDCAGLKLSLPQAQAGLTVGEEAATTVFVVPDFDSTVDVNAMTLRPSSGGALEVDNLTPGSYHVFAFPAPVELEYRNKDALAALSNAGKAITLQPGSTSSLVVEAPSR